MLCRNAKFLAPVCNWTKIPQVGHSLWILNPNGSYSLFLSFLIFLEILHQLNPTTAVTYLYILLYNKQYDETHGEQKSSNDWSNHPHHSCLFHVLVHWHIRVNRSIRVWTFWRFTWRNFTHVQRQMFWEWTWCVQMLKQQQRMFKFQKNIIRTLEHLS